MIEEQPKKRSLRIRLRNFWEKLFGRPGETMPDGGRFVSLYVRFTTTLVVSAVVLLVLYVAIIPLTMQIFRTVYMKPSHVEGRLNRYAGQFAAYVEKENIRSDDVYSVLKWTKRHRWMFLTISHENGENLHPDQPGEGFLPDEDVYDPDSSLIELYLPDPPVPEASSYLVRFADGMHTVTIADDSLSFYTNLILIGSAILTLCVFFIIMLLYYHRQVRAIVGLSDEVQVVSGGSLTAPIQSERHDEIGRLATDVNTMRNTIFEKMEKQEEAWKANGDLLTSVTHDIRTPMTTLLGYMELLNADNGNMTEEQKEYLRVCTSKTARIKDLSDKLFLYFWAYNSSETDVTTEVYQARLLIEQMVGEYIPTTQTAGLTVENHIGEIGESDCVRVSVEYLRRITDNIFDNICKYADRGEPVRVEARTSGETIVISVTNRISDRPADQSTSTRIGVKTCTNMMKRMRGTFESVTGNRTYTARLTFPLVKGACDEPESPEPESPEPESPKLDSPELDGTEHDR